MHLILTALLFAYIEGELFLMAMKNTALSACTPASLKPSYVLCALGTTDDILRACHCVVRLIIACFQIDVVHRHSFILKLSRCVQMVFIIGFIDLFLENVD